MAKLGLEKGADAVTEKVSNELTGSWEYLYR